ncbi:MAG: hypothetical protein SCK28_01345 [Bacillota bacterium]|nr:hypothetical protein [Bacillota bacterium]
MAKGFFNGLLTGTILGAVSLMFMSPQKKQILSSKTLGKSKQVRKRAGKMLAQVSDSVKDISNILKK